MNIFNLKKELQEKFPYRIEMHSHTYPVSSCSEHTPEAIVKKYKELNFDAVVITNHFISHRFGSMPKEEAIQWYVKDYYDAVNAAKKLNIKVLLGAEIRFDENCNDYLLYGADEEILKTCFDYIHKNLKTFREEVKLNDSVLVQAHPFRDNVTAVDASLVDGFETFNMHQYHNERNGLSVQYAKNNGVKIKTIGTDYHHVSQEGFSALRTAVLPNNSFELAEILKSGNYILEISDDALILP